MKTLFAPTEDFIKVETTFLTADVAAGSNISLPVQSGINFANTDFVAIGLDGGEGSEIEQINAAVTNSAMQVATLKFAHKKGDPVVKYRYNKRKFYGAITATGSFTELTGDGSPKDISIEDMGVALEYTGTTYTYFKATYYNSQDTAETDIAQSTAVLADETKRYCSLYQIRKQAGLTNNPRISDGRVEEKRKQAENEINSLIFSRYTLPLTEIPDLINRLAYLLAAGYLDYEEYGSDGNGVKWLGEARAILKSIGNGTQRLIGADGTELSFTSSSNQMQGYPNVPFDSSDPDSPVQSFSRNMKF